MSNQVTVSAPGKLMLFGEHGVVFGKPCIVTAVNQRLKLKGTKLNKPIFQLEAYDVGITSYEKSLTEIGKGQIPKGARFIEIALANFLKKHPVKSGVKFETTSEFKSVFGFGSSSASAVCTIKALSELLGISLTNKQVFDLAYQTVLDIQGVGSGFDLAAAIYGGTLFFVSGGKVLKPIQIKSLPLIVGYTGIKADTATLVKIVSKKLKTSPKPINEIFDNMENIVLQAMKILKKSDLKQLGELMNSTQIELQKLGVSSKELDYLVNASLEAGAYGSKLSGAGGGDCMISVASKGKRDAVEQAIENAGGQVLRVEVNAEGVKIEE
jgi:mevalonate kinase